MYEQLGGTGKTLWRYAPPGPKQSFCIKWIPRGTCFRDRQMYCISVCIYINIKLTSITYVSCTTSGFSIATSNIAGATFCAFCATSAHSVALGHWQSPLLSACLNFAIVGHLAETWPREGFRHFLNQNRAFQQNILGYSTNNHMKKWKFKGKQDKCETNKAEESTNCGGVERISSQTGCIRSKVEIWSNHIWKCSHGIYIYILSFQV